ncbi:MAG: N-acetylmuramic acid 6-phosphate etherase [Planctomycetota bacterium]
MRYEDLPTEQANPRTRGLDLLSTADLLRVIHEEDARAFSAVGEALPEIARAADLAAEALASGGRILYVGAGTSGRLGVLDASECPPTFGTDPSRVVGVMAGGPEAMFRAVEGAEDDREAGAADLLELGPERRDLVVGIAASGVTPYVRSALEAARDAGARRVLLTAGDATDAAAEVVVELSTGPEVVAGSTRMKAGTATKLALNMISTAAMVRIGKVYENLMVDVRAASAKLSDRAERLVMGITGRDREAARAAIASAEGEVKTAIVSTMRGVSPTEARSILADAGGFLRTAIVAGRA